MEVNLVCHEDWLSNPGTDRHELDATEFISEHCLCRKKGDVLDELGFKTLLERESCFLPETGYLDSVSSCSGSRVFRLKALRWLVKTCHRLNVCTGTIFYAANYFDRFMSKNAQFCHGSNNWMVELLLIACLSVASKFNDNSVPPFSTLLMEGLEHSFQSSTIAEMELKVLKAIDWRVSSITSYSMAELLKSNMEPQLLTQGLVDRVNDKLLTALLGLEFLRYPPSIIAISALYCGLEELIPSSFDANMTCFTRFFDKKQMDEMMKCHGMMKTR